MSFFKRLQLFVESYTYGKLLEKRTSIFGHPLEVWHQNGKIVIDSPNANQSFGGLHTAMQQFLKKHQSSFHTHSNWLILGYGGGSIAHILLDELQLDISLTGIELDYAIIELGSKYYPLKSTQKPTVVCQDAVAWLENNSTSFDGIILDLFVDERVPEEFQVEEFCSNLFKSCKPEGRVFWNLMENDPSSFCSSLEKVGFEVELQKIEPVNQFILAKRWN